MPKPTKGPRLGGGPAHERLMLANLAAALFTHKAITTTETKAKRVRPLAERLVTFAKRGDLASRRRAIAKMTDRDVVHELFDEIVQRYTNRDGGYTRIVKIGPRKGDNAPMAVIELVEELTEAPKPKRKKATTRKAAKAEAVAALAGGDDEDEAPAAKSEAKADDAEETTEAKADDAESADKADDK
jgi:large subunit ribosomal protein L17